MLTSVIGKFEKQKKYPVEIEVEYSNSTRNSFRKLRKRRFILDFREFDLVSPVPDSAKYMQEISKTLKDIEKSIKKLIGPTGVPRITTQSPIDKNLRSIIWPYLGGNTIDTIPINIQRQYIEKELKIIRNNPWYDIYTELGKLPPDIQVSILYDIKSKFSEWEKMLTQMVD